MCALKPSLLGCRLGYDRLHSLLVGILRKPVRAHVAQTLDMDGGEPLLNLERLVLRLDELGCVLRHVDPVLLRVALHSIDRRINNNNTWGVSCLHFIKFVLVTQSIKLSVYPTDI